MAAQLKPPSPQKKQRKPRTEEQRSTAAAAAASEPGLGWQGHAFESDSYVDMLDEDTAGGAAAPRPAVLAQHPEFPTGSTVVVVGVQSQPVRRGVAWPQELGAGCCPCRTGRALPTDVGLAGVGLARMTDVGLGRPAVWACRSLTASVA